MNAVRIGMFVAWAVTGALAAAQDEHVVARVTIAEPWRAVFGGAEVTYTATVATRKAMRGRSTWHLSAAERTLARGDVPLQPGAGGTTRYPVRLTLPSVKPGVAVDLQLESSAILDPPGRVVGSQLQLRLFPRDALAEKNEWARRIAVRLFDPDKTTAPLLDELKVPFEPIDNIDTIEEMRCNLIIVAEGVSFHEFSGLSRLLVGAASRRCDVLCLAPSEGEVVLTGDDVPVQPSELRMRSRRVMEKLDKRFDTQEWIGGHEPVVRRFVLRGRGADAVVAVTGEREGWPWMEMRFDMGGTLVFSGFNIVEPWESGPMPRYLLVRMMEYARERNETGQGQKGKHRASTPGQGFLK